MDPIQRLQPLIQFYRRRRRMPSLRELARLWGFRSQNAADKLAHQLIELGFLTKDTAGKLLPTRLFYAVRVLGTVEAGFPSPAEEELGDTMDLDEFLIKNKEATYMLKVTGDSIICANAAGRSGSNRQIKGTSRSSPQRN